MPDLGVTRQNPCASGSDLSPRRFVGWRVYGNQHGTWVKMPGRDYREMRALAATKGIAPEELLAEAIREHVERVLGV